AAKADMPAVALTDHGNMMGAFHFVNTALGYNKEIEAKNAEALAQGKPPVGRPLKPIVGCEFYVCEDRKDKSRKDNGYQIVFLAKISPSVYTEGFYYDQRIDRLVIERSNVDLISLS